MAWRTNGCSVMVNVMEAALSLLKPRAPRVLTHRERARRFYASLAWRSLRYRILATNAKCNGGTAQCELCHAAAAPGIPLNVDHIEPLSKNWGRRLDPDNLQILCRDCNHGKLNRDATDFRPPLHEIESSRGDTSAAMVVAGGAAGGRCLTGAFSGSEL